MDKVINTSSYDYYYDDSSTTSGVRPVISLKSKVKVAADGDGTALNPYVFIVR